MGLIASACVTVSSESLALPAESSAEPTMAATATASAAATETADPDEVEATAEPTDDETPAGTTTPEPTDEPDDALVTPDPATAEPSTVEPATVEPATTTPAIGYISLDESQAFVQTISGGVREAAAEAGIPLIECDSGWTRPGVRACAAELAEAGVTGLISMQPFPDLNEAVCEALGGVPAIGLVYDQGPCQASLFEIDQAESGRLAGAALGALAAERFECDVKAYVSLESGADDAIGGARMDGYRAGYEEHCKLPTQTRRLADAQHLITAQNQFGAALDAIKGKPIMVAGVSEDAILGAMDATERRDRTNHVWFSGQLADPAIRQAIACDKHYVASVAQFPERFGKTVVPALVDAKAGVEVPPLLQAELQLVTAENVRELFPDTPACDA